MNSTLSARDSKSEAAHKRPNAPKWPKYGFIAWTAMAGISLIPIAGVTYFDKEVREYFGGKEQAIIQRRSDECFSTFKSRMPLVEGNGGEIERARQGCRETAEKTKISGHEINEAIVQDSSAMSNLIRTASVAFPTFILSVLMSGLTGLAWMIQIKSSKKKRDDEKGGNEKPGEGGQETETKSPGVTGLLTLPGSVIKIPLIGLNTENGIFHECKSMVLLANDQADRNAMRDRAKEFGFKVSATRFEKVALDQINEKKPDTFLIYANFPDAGDLIRSIKTAFPKIMVLVLISENEPIQNHPLYAKGADALISPSALEDFGKSLQILKDAGEDARKHRDATAGGPGQEPKRAGFDLTLN